ncbi:MAG: sigma-70 family RNA polymerase sigma factor [Eubacteriales bacterium]|jgi:RNA polymerase sigma factor (sigma-70 family)
MDDQSIIHLYWIRSESAIQETRIRYGKLLRSVAYGILKSHEDAEECENDTYLKTWNQIPPTKPDIFSAFLSRITRNLSLDRYDAMHTARRGNGEVPLLLDELAECIPAGDDVWDSVFRDELAKILNSFLRELKPEARNIFMRRYWFGDSVHEIARAGGFSDSKVKMTLLRSRERLKKILEDEQYVF